VKPAPFEYRAPEGVDEALALLSAFADDAKVLAGGQSLVPAMNFRLARPEVLIDINRVTELGHVRKDDGMLRIGALARHIRFEDRVVDDPVDDLLQKTVRFVGHLPIRVRGTFGGSIAHADPAAEWCLLATLLDAVIVARNDRDERAIDARDFFVGFFTTALQPDELLTEVRLPLLGPDARTGFVEFTRRAGDFAIAAVGTVITLSGGRINGAGICIGGVAGTTVRALHAESMLTGEAPSRELFADAGAAAANEVEPIGDIHGSAEYRKDLVRTLTRRALEQALGTG
jgi:aerobic carbon-monoxide dehydrogenase medium subunit